MIRRCPLFQAAVRRTQYPEFRDRAEEGVAGCSLALGLRAEAGEKLQDAHCGMPPRLGSTRVPRWAAAPWSAMAMPG